MQHSYHDESAHQLIIWHCETLEDNAVMATARVCYSHSTALVLYALVIAPKFEPKFCLDAARKHNPQAEWVARARLTLSLTMTGCHENQNYWDRQVMFVENVCMVKQA